MLRKDLDRGFAASVSEGAEYGFAFDDDFDPLAVDDFDIDQEDMDDDNPYDTVDFPTLRNMPEREGREGAYTPERAGSAEAALSALIDRNPGRRPVLLCILDLCRDGCASSAVSEAVKELQRDNRSVYAPMTLCRMLERAGGLELEMPETSVERENPEEGVAYLEIKERIDPVWRSTEAGLAVYEQLSGGAAFRDIVLDRDSVYLDVYAAVMHAVEEKGCSLAEIEQLVDSFDIVQSPRRFGGHFIDMLERTDAIAWRDRAWHLTELGAALLPELEAARKAKAEDGEEKEGV